MRVLLISCAIVLSQCKKEEPVVPPGTEISIASIRATYDKSCMMCHGPDGRGETPMGKALDPPSRNLADPEWQKKTSDGAIMNVILLGGESAGLSAAMPANDLSPEQLKALVKLIRSFEVKTGQ